MFTIITMLDHHQALSEELLNRPGASTTRHAGAWSGRHGSRRPGIRWSRRDR